MRKKVFYLFIFIFVFYSQSFGQHDYKFSLAHRLLFNDFNQRVSDASKIPNSFPRGMELSFSKRLDSIFRVNLPVRIGFTKNSNDTTTIGRIFYGADIQGQIQYSKNRFSTYLTTGVSVYKRINKTDLGIPIFFGLNFNLEEDFALNVQSGYRMSFQRNSSSWHHSIGIVFNIDKILPPKTLLSPLHNPYRHIQTVEILDIIGWWQIPKFKIPKNVKALPEYMFPDTDEDGISDNLDKCPTRRGSIKNYGCPDVIDLSWLKDSNNIAFEFGKATLTQESYLFLDKIVEFLNEQPHINMSIAGHTDNKGSISFNQKLSEKRAKVCYDYLVQSGIESTRIKYIGFGESQPMTENLTELGRSKNRRAEFSIIDKDHDSDK